MRPDEPRTCPVGCPHIDDGTDCDECTLAEDTLDARQAEADACYDKKTQEDWNEN